MIPRPTTTEKSDRDWQVFLDTAVHDLRSQLRTIATSSGLLAEMIGDAQVDEAAQLTQRLDEGIVRMTALLKGLEEYSMALHIDDTSFGPVPTESVVRSALAGIASLGRDNCTT